MEFTSALKEPAVNINSSKELWGIFITTKLIEVLVEHNNCGNETDHVKMKALIDLLMLTGTYHGNRQNFEGI